MNYLGIDKGALNQVVDSLNQLLADYHIYYQNLRKFHWQVKGENFFDLHNLFEELYNDAKVNIDDIAERILTLRHEPISLFSDYLTTAAITEATATYTDREMVNIVLNNHGTLIAQIRVTLRDAGEAEDEGTIDLIAAILSDIEKRSWMLDSWRTRIKIDAEEALA